MTTKAFGLLLAVICSALVSLAAGGHWLGPEAIWHALVMPEADNIDDLLIRGTRASRTLIALVAGASLAVAGGLIQTVTGNPLASPGILGINAGALLALVAGAGLLSLPLAGSGYVAALLGAGLTCGLVWLIAMQGAGRAGPLRLVLAGAALAALFNAISQALLVVDQQGLDAILVWMAGSVAGHSLTGVWPMLVGAVVVMALGVPFLRHLNVLSAGEQTARTVGARVRGLQAIALLATALLAGNAVAMAGSIAFVGLIVPHLARRLLGSDHRCWLPGAAALGAMLLLWGDIVARLVIAPREVPVGVAMTLIGVPFFIGLIRMTGRPHG
ncbi:iron ABC transporter permease [Salinisphaera sp. Q1T1-3]|uniref:FecCD family ABC transporter permease n=1 Tax=Salinisphaera sp. Q1T1-3 TaxID=2321229 RepID=UPI000E75161C|nr:iron ABC transporter permease [Salinisphaera sp. Q1T1-3]RJS94398.1 iron ABC transporter permease [Salinisphaera sp. Q1T1-3]